jgi:large subunit ribosomal protein L25
MSITVNAEVREVQGKGASRRLRKEEKVPSIVYGGSKAPLMVSLNIHEITHLLENEDTFTSVLDLVIDKSKEPVVIKDLQRLPGKNSITHVDFLRIDEKHALITTTPLHFLGIEDNEALRIGNMLNQFVVSIEISCLPKDLPHGIDVDVSGLELGDHLTLTDLMLPEGVVITSLQHEDVEAHDQTVCSVTEPKLIIEEEEVEDTIDSELDEEGDAEGAEDSEGAKDSQDGDTEE